MSKNKIKTRNNSLFDIEKSSTTFMTLMSKYNSRKTKIKNNDKCYIAKEIDDKRFKLEKEEKDALYIYKEAKNISHINQELIYYYGKKAKDKDYNITKFQSPIKIGKQLFFDPTKDYTLQNSSSTKIMKKGMLKLPLISQNYLKYANKPLLTYNNNSNNLKNKYYYNKNYKINTDYSFDSNKINSESPIKKNLDSSIETETNLCPSTLRNKRNEQNILLSEILKNNINKKDKFRNRNNNVCFSNRNIFSYNGSYLSSVSDFKEQLVKEEKKQRNYFERNDYGCKLFKEKYAFLSKKYFSPD